MKRLFGGQDTPAETFPVARSEDEWRRTLDPAQFNVLAPAS
jgi:hypothetical protein